MSINPLPKTSNLTIVNADSNNPRYYMLPKQNADNFVKDFSMQKHKTNILTNATFFSSIIAGVIGMAFATSKIKNSFIRFTLNAAGGVALGIGAFSACGVYAENRQKEIEKKYHARLIKYL